MGDFTLPLFDVSTGDCHHQILFMYEQLIPLIMLYQSTTEGLGGLCEDLKDVGRHYVSSLTLESFWSGRQSEGEDNQFDAIICGEAEHALRNLLECFRKHGLGIEEILFEYYSYFNKNYQRSPFYEVTTTLVCEMLSLKLPFIPRYLH